MTQDEGTRWSPELCGLCGLPVSVFPEIVDPMTVVSPLKPEICSLTGLSPDTLVVVGATDTVMEIFAAGAIHPGDATVKLATAGRICPITTEGFPHPLLVNYPHVVPGLWYPGTTTKSCAASYRWFRDTLCGHEMSEAATQNCDTYELMDAEASKAEAGSAGLFFHPYLQGEMTPYLDNALKGSFIGISSYHKKSHFNRAVLEGVAYSLKDCLLALRGLGIRLDHAQILGGGAKSSLWCQIASDILEIPLTTVSSCDSATGSAMLAGIASGIFASFEECSELCVHPGRTYIPNTELRPIYREGFRYYQAIHDALAPIYKEMMTNEHSCLL